MTDNCRLEQWSPTDRYHNDIVAQRLLTILFDDVCEFDALIAGKDGETFVAPIYLKSQNLVVIVHTANVYQDVYELIQQNSLCKRMNDAGYKVIVIPFFINLSCDNVKAIFGKELSEQYECKLPSGFYVDEGDLYCEYAPATYCSKGWNKFLYEWWNCPPETHSQIKQSVEVLSKRFGTDLVMIELPDWFECDKCPAGIRKKELDALMRAPKGRNLTLLQ